ncbi:MAG: polysaccharide deacetylase family protein [Firmicutes bacterium]|nr:polysaccharide deacetylase family protein [Bacillota bacterium]
MTNHEKYMDKMGKEVKVITECGDGTSLHSGTSYASVVSDPYTAEISQDIIIRSGDVTKNRLALTCNVDWGEEVLPEMLEIFYKNDIRITFFVTGKWAEKNPDMLRKIYIYGHEIQSHGYSHKLSSQVAEGEVRDEIEKTEDIIFRTLGIKTDIFAPPSGDFDERTIKICKEKGYRMSLWSADTIDWKEGSTADVIYNRIMDKELKGAIILMHPKEETVKALPSLLESFKEQGLEVVTVSELVSN